MPPRRTRASVPPKPPAPAPATVVQKPEPAAWTLALHFADGDRNRLVVEDHRTVKVLNRPPGG